MALQHINCNTVRPIAMNATKAASGKHAEELPITTDYDSRRIIKSNGSMIFTTVSNNFEGQYDCQAENGVGSGLRKVVFLIVNKPVHFETNSKNLSAKINDPIELVCEAKGDFPIQIQWLHNMERLLIESYRMSVSEVNMEFGLRSQVVISRTERKDSGKYICLAENAFGRSEYNMYLAIQERPERPIDFRVTSLASRSIIISWRQEYDGHSTLRGYHIQYSILTANRKEDWRGAIHHNISMEAVQSTNNNAYQSAITYKTNLEGLKPATTYAVRIAAYNDIDKSPYSETITVDLPGEEPSEPPQNLRLLSRSPGEMKISWDAPPKDSWNGNLLGYLITISQPESGASLATNSKLVAIYGSSTVETTISRLKPLTKYEVRIRAFNSVDVGPTSASAVLVTAEGVLEHSPRLVKCTPISPQSIHIAWEPPSQTDNRIEIQGYKIHYRPVDSENLFWPTGGETKRTSSTDTYLYALQKASNYSIRVSANTAAGDGAKSDEIFCSTEEDVPGPPAVVKAMSISSNSIVITWLPPEKKNGVILHYIVYKRNAGSVGTHTQHIAQIQEDPPLANVKSSIRALSLEFYGLEQQQSYEFWVAGVTAMGEGQPSTIIVQGTRVRYLSRIASFGQHLKVAEGQGVLLHCNVPGQPSSKARWSTPLPSDSRISTDHDNKLHVRDIDLSLSGNYTCSSRNAFGGDSVTYVVTVVRPPAAPAARAQALTRDKITVTWSAVYDGGAPVLGFDLFYRQEGHEWTSVELPADVQSHTIHGLFCGTLHNIYASAYNGAGRSLSSEVIAVRTEGEAPIQPQLKDFISSNVTSVKLNLLLWNNGGCPINYFVIEYRQFDTFEWTTQKVELGDIKYIIGGLELAAWFYLKVTAHNDAGSTEGRYFFSTLTADGEKIILPLNFSPAWDTNDTYDSILSNWLALVLCILMIFIFAAILALVILNWNNKRSGPYQGCFAKLCHSDDNKSVENQDNKINCQQVYTTSPVKRREIKDDQELYEIQPYATFTMPIEGEAVHESGSGRSNPMVLNDEYIRHFQTFNRSNDISKGRRKDGRNPKVKHYSSEDDYTMSMAMTMTATSARAASSKHNGKSSRSSSIATSTKFATADDSDSDSNDSPCADCKSNSTCRTPINSYNDTLQRVKHLTDIEIEKKGLSIEDIDGCAREEKIRQTYTPRHTKDCPVHIITKGRVLTSSNVDPQWRNHIW